MATRKHGFTSEVRDAAKSIWEGLNKLKSLQREWNALDYGNGNPDIGLGPGVDSNLGYDQAEVGSVVFATADAIEALFATGHATNIANLL